jgi:hypothetical protein
MSSMPIDAAIRTVIAGAIVEGHEASGRAVDALLAMRQFLRGIQSMAPLSWDDRVVLRALDIAPINASIKSF